MTSYSTRLGYLKLKFIIESLLYGDVIIYAAKYFERREEDDEHSSVMMATN